MTVEPEGYWEPPDVFGRCNAKCYLASNCGKSYATFVCVREVGHFGSHQALYRRDVRQGSSLIEIKWDIDEFDTGDAYATTPLAKVIP